ncbi:MAG: methylmalonyl-CoA mutase, partial [Candidatus Marinimicrobia bacterium]|nr:methylmalonyl-CoA mutase [Candidatus Neomarinimicrobiota bacterium]
ATAGQELAFTFANGVAYVEAAVKAGLDVNEFGTRLSFFFNVHQDFFEEVAKFRAARRLWARIMKERFGATEPKALMCRFHTQTAGSSLTAQQIDNNVVRTTLEALSAVLGGTQSLHTNSRDEALALPSEESVRLALRTQQIIAHETGIPQIADPLAGSYHVEGLTSDLEREAMKLLAQIDELGGAISAIEAGFQADQIAESAYRYQQAVEQGEQVIVGLNRYVVDEEQDGGLLAIDPEVERTQLARLVQVKRERDQTAVNQALVELRKTALGEDNLLAPIANCVGVYATLGEIAGELREVFGSFPQG